MFEIDIELEDENRYVNKSYLKLNPNPSLYPMMSYPIKWKGKLNNNDLKILQLSASSHDEQDFVFLIFPSEYNHLKNKIIEAIHRKMNKIN